MDGNDINLLLAGFAFLVLPFLVVAVSTLAPMSDARVQKWFLPFGRLALSGVPMVRARLRHVRLHRRIGATLGATAAWLLSSWYAIRYTESFPISLFLFPVVGYVVGAALSEVRSLRRARGTRRTAELSPRRLRDYVSGWVLPLTATILGGSALVVVLAPMFLVDGAGVEPVRPPWSFVQATMLLGAGLIGTVMARSVAQLPVGTDPNVDPYLDDAFRQISIMTCLAGPALIAVATLGAYPMLDTGVGWSAWITGPMVVIVLLGCWYVMRHPVQNTFGPRLRASWTKVPVGSSPRPHTAPSE